MSSKEEILDSCIGDVIEYPDYDLNSFQMMSVFEAMDEYAKQEAIEFQNFLIDQRWFYHWYLKLYTKESIDNLEIAKANGKTIGQLYELFQQSKTTKA